jgi:hypothetical protein
MRRLRIQVRDTEIKVFDDSRFGSGRVRPEATQTGQKLRMADIHL